MAWAVSATIGKVKPENVALIGIRDLDNRERKIIHDSGINAYTMREVDERGMAAVAEEILEIVNKDGALKPEMFVNGLLESKFAANSNEILIPKSSILWTGKRAVVYVKVPDRESPSFLYREITLGPQAGSFFVVADGLNENEEIAIKIIQQAVTEGWAGMHPLKNETRNNKNKGFDNAKYSDYLDTL